MLERLALSPSSAADAEPLSAAEAQEIFARSFGRARRVVLAVSGGADSTALLVLAAESARPAGAVLAVAAVDHALRAESAAEAAGVAALAARFDLPFARLDAPLASSGSRIEAAARERRYAALAAHARAIGADAIATAHTLDDQAETVLMRLAAGSGPAGLAAIRPSTARDGVTLLRPLIGVRKARLVATLRARGLGWFEDAMNADARFARARLRASRTALEREGLTAERLATLAARMARADEALEAATDAAAEAHLARDGRCWTIAPDAAALPAEIRLRLLARALGAAGEGVVRLDRLERLALRIDDEPAGVSTLAGCRIAWRPDGGIAGAPAAARRWRGPAGAAN